MEDNYIQYEYLSLDVKSKNEPLMIDTYKNFGWKLISATALKDKEDYYVNNINSKGEKIVNIQFKRNRKLQDKEKLNKLQKECEQSLNKIEKLEKKANEKGIVEALTIGILGCVLLAISVFIITGDNVGVKEYAISTPIGLIGILAWIYPYFRYKKVKEATEEKNKDIIEQEYDIIYNICEKSRKILGE